MCVWACVCDSWRAPSFLIHSSETHLSGHRTVIHCLTAVSFLWACPAWILGSNSTHRASWRFSWKKKEKKKTMSPVLTHSPANSTKRASLIQKSTEGSSNLYQIVSCPKYIKIDWTHNWSRLLIQLSVGPYCLFILSFWTSSQTTLNNFPIKRIEYILYWSLEGIFKTIINRIIYI